MPLVFGPESLRLQLAVPATFNPRHQLNPLKVFADRSFVGANGQKSSFERAHTDDHSEKDKAVETLGPRLFTPFLDTIDGVTCVAADITASELRELIGPHHLRFPLMTDASLPLATQVKASEYAPASSRFGELCDNIIGMNWRLADGRIVRIGERVVKSTTGYDLLRFLMHSDGRFGEPVDFVLRLRPHCGMDGLIELSGTRDVVTKAMPELLQSCWMNWFDSVDVLAESKSDFFTLRIAINTPSDEWHVFESMLAAFASAQKLAFKAVPQAPAPIDGCPDFALKTTPDRVVALASELAATYGIKCLALCYNGVVHGYLNDVVNASAMIQKIIQSHAKPLHDSGGDWHSRHLPRAAAQRVEAQWLSVLTTEFSKK
jgi:hypothetical protein